MMVHIRRFFLLALLLFLRTQPLVLMREKGGVRTTNTVRINILLSKNFSFSSLLLKITINKLQKRQTPSKKIIIYKTVICYQNFFLTVLTALSPPFTALLLYACVCECETTAAIKGAGET